VWWIFSIGQLVACCCCPCIAGQSIGCWVDLGDASSFGQEDGRESDRHDTGVFGGLACLQEAWQCDRRRSSGGVWWDPTPDLDRCVLWPRSSWCDLANGLSDKQDIGLWIFSEYFQIHTSGSLCCHKAMLCIKTQQHNLHNQQSSRLLYSSSQSHLHVPRIKTDFGRHAFSSDASQIWNNIPTAIRVSPSLDSFKRHLKTHYFASP